MKWWGLDANKCLQTTLFSSIEDLKDAETNYFARLVDIIFWKYPIKGSCDKVSLDQKRW